MEVTAEVNFYNAIAYMPAITPRQKATGGAKVRGLRTIRNYHNNFRISSYISDMIRYSSVEEIKEPSSVITAHGERGGVINCITKKPLRW